MPSYWTPGLYEAVLPSFSGWLQYAYRYDKTMPLVQAGPHSSSCIRSWCMLFSQCGITSNDFEHYGNFRSPTSQEGMDAFQKPRADLLVEGGKTYYGFSQVEFFALVILCGFTTIGRPGVPRQYSSAYIGTLYLSDQGHSPFSQYARFDPHGGTQGVSTCTVAHSVPVARSLDLALGIIRTPFRPSRKAMVFPCRLRIGQSYWETLPHPLQLKGIRDIMESLLRKDEPEQPRNGALQKLSELPRLSQRLSEKELEDDIAGLRRETRLKTYNRTRLHFYANIIHALGGLRPWNLLPSVPAYVVEAFTQIIEPLVGTRDSTVRELRSRVRELGAGAETSLKRWGCAEDLEEYLDRLGDIKMDHFSACNEYCSAYWHAMDSVFATFDIETKVVRVTLAYEVVKQDLSQDVKGVDNHELFAIVAEMLDLKPEGRKKPAPAPDWAVTIYVTFLWGWLKDSTDVDVGLLDRFQRRVFLG